MKTTLRSAIILSAVFGLACCAAGADLLSAPQAIDRPWAVLKNTMTTTHMRIFAVKTAEALKIDGRADEGAWKSAFSVSSFGTLGLKGFTERKNSARLLFDDKALYIACTGELGAWADWLAPQRGRDQGAWQDESFEIFLDPGLTRKTYYHFIVNAAGSIQDGKVWDDRTYNPDYTVAASHDEKSYTVELAIPWAAFDRKGPPAEADLWSLNICRNDKETKEGSSIIPVPTSFHDPSSFAQMQFGEAPQVFLDNFAFDQIVRGDNVFRFRAHGSGIQGAKAIGVLTGPGASAGKPPVFEIPLVANGVTIFPFKLTDSGTSVLRLDVVKDGKTLNSYRFNVMLYEDRLLLPVTGGPDFYQGTPLIDLRIDVRLKPELLRGKSIAIALKQGDKVLNQATIDRIPGVYFRSKLDTAALPVGQYALHAMLLDAGKEIQTTTSPITIIDDPFDKKAVAPATGDSPAAEVPELFKVWGKIGPDVRYRIATQGEIDTGAKRGQTAEYVRNLYDVRAWPEKQTPGQCPNTTFTDAEKKQGYVLFARHYMDRVFPYTIPHASERISEVRTFAAQGEYEPLTFSIHAINELKDVKVEISDLSSGGAAPVVLAKEHLDVRAIRCYPKPFAYPWWDPDKGDRKLKLPYKETIPLILEKRDSFDIPAGQSKQVWITLKVPDSSPAGIYTGSVRAVMGDRTARVPITIRILPFPLVRLDKAVFLYDVPPEKNAYIDYREHGFNIVNLHLRVDKNHPGIRKAFEQWAKDPTKDIKIPLADVDDMFAANKFEIDKISQVAKEAKFAIRKVYFVPAMWFIAGWDYSRAWGKQFPITPERDQNYVDVVNKIISYTREQGLAEFIVVPGDEPAGHPETLPGTIHYLELTKEKVKGARTAMTIGGGLAMGIDEFEALGTGLDLAITNCLSASSLADARRLKKELWIYNVGSTTTDPQKDRHAYGYFAWKVGATGMAHWIYRGGNYLNMSYAIGDNWAFVFAGTDGRPIPTIHYESFREALDDQRYGATLSGLIEKAEAGNNAKAKQAAAHARATIARVLDGFKLTFMDRSFPNRILREFDTATIDAQTFDTYRWELAREIMALQQALGDKGVIDSGQLVAPLVP